MLDNAFLIYMMIIGLMSSLTIISLPDLMGNCALVNVLFIFYVGQFIGIFVIPFSLSLWFNSVVDIEINAISSSSMSSR